MQTNYQYNSILFIAIGACLLVTLAPAASAENVRKSEAFVDSVGINLHLNYSDSAYSTRFTEVQAALKQLRIRHFRDGLVTHPIPSYIPHLRELGSIGMKGIFITDPRNSIDDLADFPQKVPQLVEGYEAPNEMDGSKDPHWNDTLSRFLPTLSRAASSRSIPAIGPSLVKKESYPRLGQIGGYVSIANLHNYPGGRNPGTHGWGANGYGSLDYHKRNVSEYEGTLPVMSTETGYTNDPSAADSVPEEIAATYFPRLLLFQFMNGVNRTYIYELLSSGREDFGLMTRNCEPKPAFKAIAALMQLLDDRDLRPRAEELPLQLDATAHDLQHLLLEKSDGRYFIPLWIEEPGYDVNAKRKVDVPPGTATLHLPWIPRSVSIHQWTPAGDVQTTSVHTEKVMKVPVRDTLTILEVVPPSNARLASQNARRADDQR